MIDIEAILQDYRKKGYELSNPQEVKSGKEATLFVVGWSGRELALKVYIDPNLRSFQATGEYTSGKYQRNPSERRSSFRKSRFGKDLLHRSWVRREFFLLEKARERGIPVPEVYECTNNSVLMEFIGDAGNSAPRLIDAELSKDRAEQALESLLKTVRMFLDLGMVHGDLSEYNILYWNETPYVIDLPQAIDIRENPNVKQFLRRDLDNLIRFFGKFISVDSDKIHAEFRDLLEG